MTINFIIALNNHYIFNEYMAKSIKELIHINKNPNISIKCYPIEDGSSIFEKYNRGIELSHPAEDDLCVFIHEDVRIPLPEIFISKIIKIFEDKKIGVLGVVGTESFTDKGGWWLTDFKDTFGRWFQGHPNGTSTYMLRNPGFTDDLVSVDGCCMIVPGHVLNKIKFDSKTYNNSYHFYDADFCFTCLEQGYKIVVRDILIEHASEGPLTEGWIKTKDIFLNMWKSKGYHFPITKEQFRKKLDINK